MAVPGSQHQHPSMVMALSDELAQKLNGFMLTDAYTLSKEELVLVFSSQASVFVIRAVQAFQTCFMFFESAIPPKVSNAQPCFELLYQQKITRIEQHGNNRSFAFHFNNGNQLVFKLYDGLVNVLLFANDQVVNLFRKGITNDWDLTPASFISGNNSEIQKATHFYIYKQERPHAFVLTFASGPGELVYEGRSAIEAFHVFSKWSLNAYRFSALKLQLINASQKLLNKTDKLLAETKFKIEQNQSRITDEEVANIIMANLHAIPPHSTSVELFDFYRDQSILVKLKKDLNAQQNATYYYRKAKNRTIETTRQQQRITELEAKVRELTQRLQSIEHTQNLKDLRRFVKSEMPKEKTIPFRQFVVSGFDIWVGKGAANNDELTLRFSHKNDLWLHAKDVAGSHVLIKWKPGKEYSKEVVFQAAQIAAYYSKLKGSNLVPVTYTLKKFVRKPKGAEPGLVVVDQEEVVMVTPQLPG